jgi:hypothetical protein
MCVHAEDGINRGKIFPFKLSERNENDTAAAECTFFN